LDVIKDYEREAARGAADNAMADAFETVAADLGGYGPRLWDHRHHAYRCAMGSSPNSDSPKSKLGPLLLD
jgi:hypothetical protein